MLLQTHVGTQEIFKSIITLPMEKKWTLLGLCLLSHWLHVYSIPRHDCQHFFVSINTPFTKHTVHIGICSKDGDWMKFAIMESEIFVVITLLQMLVPISLFDNQEHLLIVLVHEVK